MPHILPVAGRADPRTGGGRSCAFEVISRGGDSPGRQGIRGGSARIVGFGVGVGEWDETLRGGSSIRLACWGARGGVWLSRRWRFELLGCACRSLGARSHCLVVTNGSLVP